MNNKGDIIDNIKEEWMNVCNNKRYCVVHWHVEAVKESRLQSRAIINSFHCCLEALACQY